MGWKESDVRIYVYSVISVNHRSWVFGCSRFLLRNGRMVGGRASMLYSGALDSSHAFVAPALLSPPARASGFSMNRLGLLQVKIGADIRPLSIALAYTRPSNSFQEAQPPTTMLHTLSRAALAFACCTRLRS